MACHSATRPDLGATRASLARVLKKYGHERLELEFRLGHRVAGKFVPGVSAACWELLKTKLEASPSFEVVVSNTRELISDDGSGGKYVIPEGGEPFWMHKKRLCDTDIDTGSTWCCRTSMSLETVDRQRRQPPVTHRFERHKQRWAFRYRCWSVDMTRVASNLPHQLDNDGISYEVEIELVDASELFARPLDNLLEWGWRIVDDACGFMAAP
jgi:hypothetical protein